jgi:hypothetical protein
VTAFRVTLSQVGISKFNPHLHAYFLAYLAERFVLLMGANEQAGGKGTCTQLSGGSGRPVKAQPEAIAAAPDLIVDNLAKVLYQIVTVSYHQRHRQALGQGLYRTQTCLVF